MVMCLNNNNNSYASKWKFTRRALTSSAHGCIGVLPKYGFMRILGQALQDYPGLQDEDNVHVSDLGYADDIVTLSSSYREMQGVPAAVNRHAAAVGMRTWMSAPGN